MDEIRTIFGSKKRHRSVTHFFVPVLCTRTTPNVYLCNVTQFLFDIDKIVIDSTWL